MLLAILINTVGLILIAFTVWWFWLGTSASIVEAGDTPIDIDVANGIYTPAIIHGIVGKRMRLHFRRRDASSCAAIVSFPELGITRELPLNQTVAIDILSDQVGTYEFTCAMGMYRGKVIIS